MCNAPEQVNHGHVGKSGSVCVCVRVYFVGPLSLLLLRLDAPAPAVLSFRLLSAQFALSLARTSS